MSDTYDAESFARGMATYWHKERHTAWEQSAQAHVMETFWAAVIDLDPESLKKLSAALDGAKEREMKMFTDKYFPND